MTRHHIGCPVRMPRACDPIDPGRKLTDRAGRERHDLRLVDLDRTKPRRAVDILHDAARAFTEDSAI